MKIADLTIQDFRQFAGEVEFDFTDAFGQARDTVLLVGPNGSGKTTILDAIAFALEPSLGQRCTRPDVPLSPHALVHHGATQAQVRCRLRFTDEEVAACVALLAQAGRPWPRPTSAELALTWTYPHPDGASRYGRTDYEPADGRALLSARRLVAELFRTGAVTADGFATAGGVFTFDQQRASIKRVIPPSILQLIRPGSEQDDAAPTGDTREILLALAIRAHAKPVIGRPDSPFAAIQHEFARLCRPQRLVGLRETNGGELDIEFTDGRASYGYHDLSSGEQAVLAFLVPLAEHRAAHSLLLIDELELHLHPRWQRRVLHALEAFASSNQLIVTTHSPHLRDGVARGAVITLGELGDAQDRPAVLSRAHG